MNKIIYIDEIYMINCPGENKGKYCKVLEYYSATKQYKVELIESKRIEYYSATWLS